jgi:hypothetical protein
VPAVFFCVVAILYYPSQARSGFAALRQLI